MSCSVFPRERVEHYVTGPGLPDDDAFEQHLLECRHCRDAVHHTAALRRELARTPGPGRGIHRWVLGGAIAAAAAVTVALLSPTSRSMRALRTVVAPTFIGVPIRTAEDGADGRIDRGMAAYVAADYRTAVRYLGEAFARDSSPPLAYYLGAALLMQGNPRRALAVLARATASGDSPYAVSAALLAAKAHLQLGDPDAALDALDRARPLVDSAGAHIAALRDSIRSIRR